MLKQKLIFRHLDLGNLHNLWGMVVNFICGFESDNSFVYSLKIYIGIMTRSDLFHEICVETGSAEGLMRGTGDVMCYGDA